MFYGSHDKKTFPAFKSSGDVAADSTPAFSFQSGPCNACNLASPATAVSFCSRSFRARVVCVAVRGGICCFLLDTFFLFSVCICFGIAHSLQLQFSLSVCCSRKIRISEVNKILMLSAYISSTKWGGWACSCSACVPAHFTVNTNMVVGCSYSWCHPPHHPVQVCHHVDIVCKKERVDPDGLRKHVLGDQHKNIEVD